ncbi:MAG: DUF58 domain-containing protein [Pirellulales bacterium]|nr:DUF58 domain-containing protein [Pirellulales bacterium]
MIPRPSTTLCREGFFYLLITALVFAGAMLQGVNLLLVLAGMMLGPLLFSWAAVRLTLRRLEVRRRLPQAVCAGDLLSVSLRLKNARPRFGCWAVTAEEPIERQPENTSPGRNPPREKPLRTEVYFPYVPADRELAGSYQGRLFQRGRYRLGPARLTTRFPFGFFQHAVRLEESDTLYVYPRLGKLTSGWLTRRRPALAGSDRRQHRPGPEGDFYGVRQWRSGDSLRIVHWRSSARSGKLVVRQFEQPRNRDVAVLLDLWQPAEPGRSGRENVELAVSFAATVLADLCRQGGSQVHLATCNDRPECVGGPASAALLQSMMKTLALAEAQAEDRLPALMEHALGKIARGAEVVLVSTRPVELSDPQRFAAVWSNPVLHAALPRVRVVDASSPELAVYYTVE